MFPFVFGTSERMKNLERRAGSIAHSGLAVLIEGESGTGKEALAEHLDRLSGGGEFKRVLCRQLSPGPAAAGSANGNPPFSELRDGREGTLYFKDVQLLSSAAQEQLLGFIEQGLASNGFHDEDAARMRIISSTSESLEESVKDRRFLAALYYRLSVYRIYIPPLRERVSDIPELFAAMMARWTGEGYSAPHPPAAMMDALMAYAWPGNVRELQNIARTYVITGDPGEVIADLGRRDAGLIARAGHQPEWSSLKAQVQEAAKKLETEIILKTLEQHRWNRRRAAQSLKISYRSLLYKMKNCNLRLEAPVATEGTE
jgi:two-component system response regulator AtoC